MRASSIVPVLLGLIAGMAALYFGLDMLQKPTTPTGSGLKLIVSRAEIPHASAITAEMLGAMEWAGESPLPDSFSDAKTLIGRVTSCRVVPGVPLVAAMLAPEGTPPGAEWQISPGYQTVEVKVKANSVNVIEPGHRVDVQCVPRQGGKAGADSFTLQNIGVFAVGPWIMGAKKPAEKDPAETIALIVPTRDVGRFIEAAEAGTVFPRLRAMGDDAIAQSPVEVQKPELPPPATKPVVAAPAPPPIPVETRRAEIEVQVWNANAKEVLTYPMGGPAPPTTQPVPKNTPDGSSSTETTTATDAQQPLEEDDSDIHAATEDEEIGGG